MNIFFDNPNDTPVPPDEVTIRSLKAAPYEDHRRVAVEFELTPFEEKPNIEISVTNAEGRTVATFSVLEAIENRMSFTMHLREPNPIGDYTLTMLVYYIDLSALEDEETPIKDMLLDTKKVVTEAKAGFSIPGKAGTGKWPGEC